MAKKADLRAAKERKQKKIAAVGGVLLVIVLFVQVPRTLDMMSDGGEEPAAAAPAIPAATTPAAAPGSPAPAAEPETVVTASLVSFSRFESKDPFVQQVKDEQGASGETPAGSSSGDDVPDGAISGPELGEGAAPAPAPVESVAKTQAEIAVNGVLEAVSVDTPFPAANPMFLLVSVAPKSASIKVADGGSFASGAPTLKLALGKPVTLVNTADGTRFVLLLKRVP